MKYLKRYNESLTDKQTLFLHEVCGFGANIKYNYSDGTVDVNGDVLVDRIILSKIGVSEIPIKFGRVSGNFYCSNNNLTTLEGCPISVGGDFSCRGNNLTTLEGCPISVGGDFFCYNNKLITLKGCPKSITGTFHCANNNLTTLIGGPEYIGGDFQCYNNNLTTLIGSPEIIIGDFNVYGNKLIDFRGFPEFYEGILRIYNNPAFITLMKFPDDKVLKAIYWINELDAIQDGKEVEERIEEVAYQLNVKLIDFKQTS